jgi:hypothetical protein
VKRRKNRDWKNEFIPIIKNSLDELKQEGEKPSVRGMWYIPVSRYSDKILNILVCRGTAVVTGKQEIELVVFLWAISLIVI